MRKSCMKFRSDFKKIFYVFFTALFLTGSVWWAMEKWVRVQTSLGADHHPLQGILLRLHGVIAYFILILLGYLVHSHIRPGLKAKTKKSFVSGWIMNVMTGLLVLTSATDLFGPEGGVREFLVTCHRFLGLGFPLILFIHLINRKFHPPQVARSHHRFVRIQDENHSQ